MEDTPGMMIQSPQKIKQGDWYGGIAGDIEFWTLRVADGEVYAFNYTYVSSHSLKISHAERICICGKVKGINLHAKYNPANSIRGQCKNFQRLR